ncbi:MAG TPA: hypothetical protein VFG14_05295 [Chthoniobacteraceae bacterium]|nr:hypothetical protein [Chthoniobacteraceae bacterium]
MSRSLSGFLATATTIERKKHCALVLNGGWLSTEQIARWKLGQALRALHDRLIVVDLGEVWILSQSIKDFAKRSPGIVTRIDTEFGEQKIIAYENLWANSNPI